MGMINIAGKKVIAKVDQSTQTELSTTVVAPWIFTDNRPVDFEKATESQLKKLVEMSIRPLTKNEEKYVTKDQRQFIRKISSEVKRVTQEFTVSFFN